MINIIKFVCPFYYWYLKFRKSQTSRVTFLQYFRFHILKIFMKIFLFDLKKEIIYWPVHKNSTVTHSENIYVGINSKVGALPGCYIQGNGGIFIGNYVDISFNVGIISGNHDVYDQTKHINKEVIIDDYCWIGMNSVILPGVHLGPRTVVGAGSVVTKSFPNGYCVIAGNPAKIIYLLEKSNFIPQCFTEKYYGFIPQNKFLKFVNQYRKKNKYFEMIIKNEEYNIK